MGATLLDRTTGPQNEQDIAAAGDTRYLLDTRILNVNGGVEVSQELGLTGRTLTLGNVLYGADMWSAAYSQAAATAVVTLGQIAASSFPVALPGFPNALQIKATTALTTPTNGDAAIIRTPIEGYRMARLGWGATNPSSIAYGFWFYPTVSGTIFVRVQNSAQNRSYHHEHAVVGGIWTWCSAVVPGDASGTWLKDNGIGMTFDVVVAGKAAAAIAPDAWGTNSNGVQTTNSTNLLGANNNVCIVTGLVVVPGTAIPNNLRLFGNMRTFDEELMLCQRYWEKSYEYGTALGTATSVGAFDMSVGTAGTGQMLGAPTFTVTKRAAPTVTVYDNAGTAGVLYRGANGQTATIYNTSARGFIVYNIGGPSAVEIAFSWKADARL